jgi:hypothetical protein
MNIIRNDLSIDKSQIIKLPSRVITNNKIISIYQSDSPDSLYKTYNLIDIKILRPYKNDPYKCVEIGTIKDITILCDMSEKLTKKPTKFVKKWIEELNDFKNNCKDKCNNKKENIYKNPKVIEFINKLQEEKMIKNSSPIKNLNDNKVNAEYRKQLKFAQILAWKAMDKELKYEERLEKEEILREQKEKETVNVELTVEKKKQDNICKAITYGKNKIIAEKYKQKLKFKKEIDHIKQEIKKRINKNRLKFKEKIQKMQKKHEMNIMKTKSKISEIRKTVTTELIKAEKKGDIKKCLKKTRSFYRKKYCDENFHDDFYNHAECLKEKEFCSICCENEFGDLHQPEREICLSRC